MSTEHNFCFPVRDLENDVLKLTPFNAHVHGQMFVDESKDNPSIFTYLPWGPFETVDELRKGLLDFKIDPDSGNFFYVIYDKKFNTEPTFAGTIGYINSSAQQLCTEIGFITILPKYQRTHVTTNACGLLLQYALDLPKYGGLGLRRVQWQTSSNNKKSYTAAIKLGFKSEGIARWQRVLPLGEDKLPANNGIERREGDPRREYPGRDTAILSLCWDDWEDGGKERVAELMKPR